MDSRSRTPGLNCNYATLGNLVDLFVLQFPLLYCVVIIILNIDCLIYKAIMILLDIL